MRVKMSKPPPPTASAIGPCPTVIKIVGRPGTGRLPVPSHLRYTRYRELHLGGDQFFTKKMVVLKKISFIKIFFHEIKFS